MGYMSTSEPGTMDKEFRMLSVYTNIHVGAKN